MRKAAYDPGLTQQFTAPFRRIINRDGSFNVHRRGATWHDFHPYLQLINMSWPRFFASLFLGYVAVNLLFALMLFALPADQLQGGEGSSQFDRFLNDFFFSSHTLTTVGYGNIAPKGIASNIVAWFESLIGVLGFAVATGLLFGRVSRPSAKFGYSKNMIIAPYQDGTSLQFRVVNRRQNSIMELECRMMLMTVEMDGGQPQRRYSILKLERDKVLFLPLTWTIVHPIDGESPLWSKSAADMQRLQAEVLILLKAYDDTFSQTVISTHSYRHDEMVWDKRFAPAFFVNEEGDLVLELPKVGELSS